MRCFRVAIPSGTSLATVLAMATPVPIQGRLKLVQGIGGVRVSVISPAGSASGFRAVMAAAPPGIPNRWSSGWIVG
jgi:DNA-binding transcriptional regulator LsrR (DeoR family)